MSSQSVAWQGTSTNPAVQPYDADDIALQEEMSRSPYQSNTQADFELHISERTPPDEVGQIRPTKTDSR